MTAALVALGVLAVAGYTWALGPRIGEWRKDRAERRQVAEWWRRERR